MKQERSVIKNMMKSTIKSATTSAMESPMSDTHEWGRQRRRVVQGLAALAAGPGLLSQGWAQEWKPTKPIRLIVGFGPGGSADILARTLQGPMSQKLGTQIVVENIAGASAQIAVGTLARSAPDGHTIGLAFVGSHAINPALYGSKLPYRVPDDFTPITRVVSQPNVLIINNNVPAKNVQEFVAWIKANPGQNFGSAGIGTSNHLCGELIGLRYNTKLVHIPYKGAAQVLVDLMGGVIPMTFDNVTTGAKLASEGKVRAIAVTTAIRSPRMPNIPTFAESGAPGFDLASWQGLFAPKGLPPVILKALYEAALFAMNEPAANKRLVELGSEPAPMDPAQFSAFILEEMKKWGDIVRQAGVKPE